MSWRDDLRFPLVPLTPLLNEVNNKKVIQIATDFINYNIYI